MSKVSHSVLLGRKLNQNQPFYQVRNLLHQDRSLKTIRSPFSLLLRYLISLCFCFRLSEAFNSTIQTKKVKIQTCISNTAGNLFDRCGENKKYFRHIFRLMKKIEFYFTLFTSRSKCFLSILTIERVTTSLIWTTTLSVQTTQGPFLQWTILSWTTEFPIWVKRGKRCTVRILPKLLLDWWKTLHLSSNRSKDVTRIFEPKKNKEIQS